MGKSGLPHTNSIAPFGASENKKGLLQECYRAGFNAAVALSISLDSSLIVWTGGGGFLKGTRAVMQEHLARYSKIDPLPNAREYRTPGLLLDRSPKMRKSPEDAHTKA
jgi:hypothetical protein